MNDSIKRCPESLPSSVERAIEAIAEEWANSELRPKPDMTILKHWDALIDDWVKDAHLPLYTRRFNETFTRGSKHEHSSGRQLVPADNTPAHWAFSCALRGERPTLKSFKRQILGGEIPVAMMFKSHEKGTAEFNKDGRGEQLGKLGWKVCHRSAVKLGRGSLLQRPIEEIEKHFKRFMAPSNMFLVPKKLAGLGELSIFIAAMKDHS